MSNKGITYFRLKSKYEGDVTKNCALDGYEVDSNFYTLEGRDIKSIEVNGDEVVITLMNGDTLSSGTINDDVTKDLTFSFNATKGVLYITRNGVTQEISGFSTVYNTGKEVATNETLVGNGTSAKPIGISKMHKTGMYKPVIKFVDIKNKEKLPDEHLLRPGDRFVTLESVSEHGLLYNFTGVKEIMKDLAEEHSQWRIPTKDDWDGMLNAIEPNQCDRNHASVSSKYLGKYAGKLLKSKHLWMAECPAIDTDTCIEYSSDEDSSSCEETEGGCNGPIVYDTAVYPNMGVDKYGFAVIPSGYADDGANYEYFQERGWFWTSDTNSTTGNVYTKRFEYNKSSVYQGVVSTGCYLSLRLVKDYTGDNFVEREEILGHMYSTVMLPSEKSGNLIWTSVNINVKNKHYCCIKPNDGIGLSAIDKYFINEWNGHKWLINELKEGESVVIINAPNDGKDVEYRIIDGELTNTSVTVYDEVVTTITEKLTDIEESINILNGDSDTEGSVAAAVAAEASEREAADEALQEAIDSLVGGDSVDEDYDTISEIASALATLNGDSDTEGSVAAAVAAEASEREAADEALSGLILTSDGTEFDDESGILTLKSNGGANDILVQFSFNFGTI